MAKVTSKLQVTIPKALAELYGIRPGDDADWVAAGDAIRVVPAAAQRTALSPAERVERFDAATARQAARERQVDTSPAPAERGWTRAELYDRGRTD